MTRRPGVAPRVVLVAWLLAIAVSLLALRAAEAPFVWIFAAFAIAFAGTFAATASRMAQIVCANAGLSLGALLIVEGTLAWQDLGRRPSYAETEPYRRPHPLYGVTGVPDADTRVSRHLGDELIWSARYTLDRSGLRVTPRAEEPVHACLIFFGCSFTFGDGVDNEQTLPYRVGALAGKHVATVNLAVGGGGAQQMLAQLEEGRVREVSPCVPTGAIYTALPHHVHRLAGNPPRYNFGPRYVLEQGGRVGRRGQIGDVDRSAATLRERLLGQVEKSYLVRTLLGGPRLADDNLRTYGAVVKAAADRFQQQFPGASFDVLLWDDVPRGDTPLYRNTLAELRRLGLQVYPIPEVIPAYSESPSDFQLHPLDRHPNARAYDATAHWIVATLLNEHAAADSPAAPEARR